MSKNYTQDGVWSVSENGSAKLGISNEKQEEIGELVFVTLPSVGKVVAVGETIAELESQKAVVELKSPVAGKVSAVNTALESNPTAINNDAENTWICEITL